MKGKFANKRQDDKVIDDFLAANPASARLSESEPEDLEECQNDAQKKTATSKWGLKKSAYYQPETKVVKKSKNADHDKKDSDEADIDYEIANELKQNFTKNLTKSDYTLGLDLQSSSDDEDESSHSVHSSDSEKNAGISDGEDVEILRGLEHTVKLYETLMNEIEDLWQPMMSLIDESENNEEISKIIPNEIADFVKFAWHLYNLYSLNLNFALLIGSKSDIEKHEVSERIKSCDKALRHFKKKDSEFKYSQICRKIIENIDNEIKFSINSDKPPTKTDNLDRNTSQRETNAKKRKSKAKTKNPRAIRLKKFEKQVAQWQSKVPKLRDPAQKYDGEKHGIRKNAVRSRKF